MKIAVITDSGSNVFEEKIKMPGLYVLPLTISDDENTYLEGVDITTAETYGLMAQGKLLKTSQPPLGLIEELFEKLKNEYDMLFAVPITSGLSGCLSAMKTTAERFNISFDYFDCYSTASNQLHLAMAARTLFDRGVDVDQVKKKLEEAAENSVTFVLPVDMKHLVRGGRLTKRAATLAGLFKIIPVLIVNRGSGGKNDVFDKVRTLRRAEERVIEYFKEHNVGKGYRICVAHVSAQTEGERFLARMNEVFPEADSYLTLLISTVGVHTGLGCIACQFIKKVEL
ncbi:MAG: DegV family protein [Erysipelotrichaceae bacterium]|nr:DegV family protein [Erysipelotrichaceae bacterium]MDD3924591.1 DegV family protein [Erysipelotrichaceae bacterium]MDD4642822.1 DegV family protein [Erysipelotrichaceae bacterium]